MQAENLYGHIKQMQLLRIMLLEMGLLTLLITGENTQESGFMQSQKTMTIIITFKGNIVSNYKSLSTNF
ncbi:unknown function [Francisella orientalis str. Toba 04]|nr:unknown function [Francisella orientalis str. Toba 04]AHB99274.1 hypothetical protein M973_07930 [Francisella orientalis LADL 07-285A]